jgi:RNA polymerase sigma factor (TIGR02999 family)
MAQEQPGQTLQPTALVHEAYLRLVGHGDPVWQNLGHFFAAAAEAMRRIVVEKARRKKRPKHGGDLQRFELCGADLLGGTSSDKLLVFNLALHQLAGDDATAAQVAKLLFYAGPSVDEAAEALGLSRAIAYRHWAYARAGLHCVLRDRDESSEI